MASFIPRIFIRHLFGLVDSQGKSLRQPRMHVRQYCCSMMATTVVLNCRSAEAWTQKSTRFIHSNENKSLRPALHLGSSALYSMATAEEEMAMPSPSVDWAKRIAEGSVISQFKGGLTAVLLNDDDDPITSLSQVNSDHSFKSNSVPASTPTSGTAIRTAPNSSSNSGDLLGKQVRFSDGSAGVVIAHRPPLIFVFSDVDPIVDENDNTLVEVFSYMTRATVRTPPSGIVDFLGRAILNKDKTQEAPDMWATERAIFSSIPQVKDIALVNNPMLTGITMLDALAPIGRGQNMLMIGDKLEEMRGYCLDMLQTQQDKHESRFTECIYATTCSSASHHDVVEQLKLRGLKDKVHVVAPLLRQNNDGASLDSESQAGEAVAIAGAACAMGEAFALERGAHALVIVDTIDSHKILWDSTTRLLVQVFGVDSVVKGDLEGGGSSEMRAYYSSLIQRSAQYNDRLGGGSVTLILLTTIPPMAGEDDVLFQESDFSECPAKIKDRVKNLIQRNIPLTAVNLRKLQIPIPSAEEGKRRLVLQHVDELISMTDGQIWFDEDLRQRGQYPPMDPQRSLTRIGIGADTDSRADAPAIRRVAEGLRLDLAQAANLDGVEASLASQRQIRRQRALLWAMHQPAGRGGRRLSESCVALLAASQGYVDESVKDTPLAGTSQGDEMMQKLLDHVNSDAGAAMAAIDETFDFSATSRDELIQSVARFFEAVKY